MADEAEPAVTDEAEPAVTDEAEPAVTDESGSRGQLVIKERVIAKIATAAALSVPGVIRQSGGLIRITGRDLPRADVSMGTQAVAINLYIAAQWPYQAAPLTRRVHAAVGQQLRTLAGLPLHQLNVLVASTAPPQSESTDAAMELADTDDFVEQRVESGSATVITSRPPTAYPAAVPAAALIAVALLGLAVAGGRELLIIHGTIAGAPWLRNTFEWFGRLHWHQWIGPTAVAFVVVGLILIYIALKPRTKTHVPLSVSGSVTTVWMRPTDLARMCSARAGSVPGVHSAQTTVDHKRITVQVLRSEDDTAPGLAEAVREAIEPKLTLLGTPLQLVVKVKS